MSCPCITPIIDQSATSPTPDAYDVPEGTPGSNAGGSSVSWVKLTGPATVTGYYIASLYDGDLQLVGQGNDILVQDANGWIPHYDIFYQAIQGSAYSSFEYFGEAVYRIHSEGMVCFQILTDILCEIDGENHPQLLRTYKYLTVPFGSMLSDTPCP